MPSQGNIDLMKRSLIAKQPEGPVGHIKTGSDEDKWLDALAEFYAGIKDRIDKLEYVRDPGGTEYLGDLENDFGMIPRGLTEAERRSVLSGIVYHKPGTGSIDDIRIALENVGINAVVVVDNDYGATFDLVIGSYYPSRASRALKARCTTSLEHRCGVTTRTGEFVVNGIEQTQKLTLRPRCSASLTSRCKDVPTERCGDVNRVTTRINYRPSKNYQSVFIVAKSVTKDPGTGKVTAVEKIDIPAALRPFVIKEILKNKPATSWGALFVNWEGPENEWVGYGFFPYGLSAFGL